MTNAGFTYNGLGDRLTQTVSGKTTTYTNDLNTGLTQVLSDGDTTYLYGLARLSQENSARTEYYLGDALGSVRQLTSDTAAVDYVASYAPYGEVLSSAGEGGSVYGYVGEATDVTGLTYLRSRFYSSLTGRFLSRDSWQGNYRRPLSLNRWIYVEGNPINVVDPQGFGNEYSEQEKPCVLADDEKYCWLNNGAFIDESHYGRAGHVTQTRFWEDINNFVGRGPTEIKVPLSTMGYYFTALYTVNIPVGIASSELRGVAAGIWLDLQRKFERLQYEYFSVYWNHGDCQQRIMNIWPSSPFETADIPSTYLGLIAAIYEIEYEGEGGIVDILGGGYSESSPPPGHSKLNWISEEEFMQCISSGCAENESRNSDIFLKTQDESGSYYVLPYPDSIYIAPSSNWYSYVSEIRFEIHTPWEGWFK